MTAYHWAARPFVVAHRGVRTDSNPQRMAPENTIPAFQEAARQGAAIELDAMLDSQGNDWVHHDDKTGRMFTIAGKQKPVNKTTPKELAQARLNVKGHEATVAKMMDNDHYRTPDQFLNSRLSRLGEVLDAVPDTHVFVELKPQDGNDAQLAKKVLQTIAEKNAQDRVTLIGFKSGSLREVKQLAPQSETRYNCEIPKVLRNNKPFLWAYVNLFVKRWVKADGIQPDYESTTPALVKISHNAKLAIAPWVYHETRAEEQKKFPELIAMGVDGIITNAVDLLNQTLGKKNIEKSSLDGEKQKPELHSA